MARRKFTQRDLKPLSKVTERILEKRPDAAVVANAAAPFKRRIKKDEHHERSDARLPVEVEARGTPDGVPLHEIARAVREEAPGMTGISVTPGGVKMKFAKEPTRSQRRKIQRLLQDRTRLEQLKPTVRAAPRAAVSRDLGDEDLRRILHDDETTDAAWLRAFRAFATANLVPPPSE